MLILTIDCPHCRTAHVAAELAALQRHPQRAHRHLPGQTGGGTCDIYTMFFTCRRCFKGVCADVYTEAGVSPNQFSGDINDLRAIVVERTYPYLKKPQAPKHVSGNVQRTYEQALDSFEREHWETAGMAFRKVLDTATKEKAPTKKDEILSARIKHLVTKGLITREMGEYADAARLDGNEATHDADEIDEATARYLREFTELFLMYTYTLPGMLEERQERKASREGGTEKTDLQAGSTPTGSRGGGATGSGPR